MKNTYATWLWIIVNLSVIVFFGLAMNPGSDRHADHEIAASKNVSSLELVSSLTWKKEAERWKKIACDHTAKLTVANVGPTDSIIYWETALGARGTIHAPPHSVVGHFLDNISTSSECKK